MMDPLTSGLLIAAAGGIVGMFIRIEHRLTNVESNVKHIKEHMTGCQQTLGEPTK